MNEHLAGGLGVNNRYLLIDHDHELVDFFFNSVLRPDQSRDMSHFNGPNRV